VNLLWFHWDSQSGNDQESKEDNSETIHLKRKGEDNRYREREESEEVFLLSKEL